MSDAAQIDRIDDESQALATAFALGELDEAGMSRLHELLQGDSPRARLVARNTWQALAMRTDLRSTLSYDSFRDMVTLKIDEGRDGSGFLRSLWRRMGWSSPQLSPVRPPPSTAPDRGRWPMRFGLALIALAIIAVLIPWRSPPSAGQVEDMLGLCRIDGRPIKRGDELGAGVLSVPEHGALSLALSDGGAIDLRGPAQATIAPRSLALSAGKAGIVTTGHGLALGGPDGHVRVMPESRVMVEIIDGHLAIGVAAGSAILRGIDGDERPIRAGQTTYRNHRVAWRQVAIPATGDWRLPPADGPSLWRITGTWQPEGNGSLSLLAADDTPVLRIVGGRLITEQQRQTLTGPPRQARNLRLRGDDDSVTLHLDGLKRPQRLDGQAPALLRITAEGRLHEGRWWNGPDPDLFHDHDSD